jgi:hypothetical protein
VLRRSVEITYQGWTTICSPSALNELSHRFARHALPIGSLGVALHLGKRRVAGDRCNLVGAASNLGKTASGR